MLRDAHPQQEMPHLLQDMSHLSQEMRIYPAEDETSLVADAHLSA